MQNVIYAVIGVIFLVMGATQVTPSVYDYIQSKKADNLALKEKSIFDAVKRYITLKGSVPPNAQALVDGGFISSEAFSDNGWGNPIALVVDNTTGIVTINTDIPNSYAKTAYMQNWKNWIKPTNPSGDTIVSSFVIPTDVLHGNSGGVLTGAYVGSSAPTSSLYNYWYDTSTTPAKLKMLSGASWIIAGVAEAITSANTVTSTSALPTTGVTEGDIRYVYNTITNTIDKYTYYGTSWTALNLANTTSRCRQNWVFINGSQGIEGSPKGWCVMKYEATPYSTTGYSTDNGAWNWQDSYDANVSMKVTSLPQNPLNYVSSNNARSICSSSHLVDFYGDTITDGFPMKYNVWKVLAKNIASNPANWSGGAVGSGYIYSGHNDGSPANAITPSTDDSNGYANTGQTTGNQKRTLFTSEGNAIWDLAGNVWEQMYEQQNVGDANVVEYTTVTTNAFSPQTIMSADWNSTQGVGTSQGDNTDNTASKLLSSGNYRINRGGHWNDGSSVGLFTSRWDGGSLSFRGNVVGVRCIVPAQ